MHRISFLLLLSACSTAAPGGSDGMCRDDGDCRAGTACLHNLCVEGERPALVHSAPALGAPVGDSSPIVLRFSAGLSRELTHLTGNTDPELDFTTGNATDDTLTLLPDALWPTSGVRLTLDVTSAAGISGLPIDLVYDVDATGPSAAAEPASGAVIGEDEVLTVRFGESIAPGTLLLGGSLAGSCATAWSQTLVSDDTLTLQPLAGWPGGAQTLVVAAEDLNGHSSTPLSLQYSVDVDSPTAVVTPPSGSTLGPLQSLTVRFDERMAPGSLVVTPAATAIWSEVRYADDTLTLTPASLWSQGTFSIDVTDLAGNPLALDLTYVLDDLSPTATLAPPDGLLTDPRQSVTILFSEPMLAQSLTLGGPAPGDADWTATAAANDTLVLAPPIDGWPGTGLLTVDATDLTGNAVATVQLRFEIAHLLDLPQITVPILALRMMDDDGGRATNITPDEVTAWVNEANRVYAVANIHFAYDGQLLEVEDTYVNQMGGDADLDWPTEVANANALAATEPGALAAIYRWGPDPVWPTGGGFSWTAYDFIAMPGFMDTWVCDHQNITIQAHEMGHYLGLPHSFARIDATQAAAASAFSGDPYIFDGDGILDTPPDPFITELQCDTDLHSVTLDGVPFLIGRDDIMSYWDSPQMTLSATQAMKVRQTALMRTGQDIRQLIAGATTAIEGEALSGAGAQDMSGFHGKWSGGEQLFWNGGAVGSSQSYGFSIAPGTYRVWAVLTDSWDFGVHTLAVNGVTQRGAVDSYNSWATHAPPLDLGTFALGASNTLTVTTAGQNTRSDGLLFGLDVLLFEVVP